MKTFSLSAIISVIGTTISSLLGGWDTAIQFLIVFMILDYATGIMQAIKTKTVNSDVMYWSAFRKAAILIVIMIAQGFDTLAAADAPIFRTLAIYFYISREGISVIENLGVIGVPLPAFIRQVLEQLKEKAGDEEPKAGDKKNE